ncbi:uncharacterized protein BO80DRAFT_467553 [Aspergillus ibericus CBS 121593]|uniref:Uncharacterized protein n=1 Tax=Aspergillus ibericus CBS 121593 TaxID=1448316 RepID=A0A395GQE3_9EURO|nr:hypothetical protein BO80DRAFT_467553 [Aspergillus ibericus CBS 121593]RAK97699.1 hypothetical protein BO80DRAFT_467553 [Aspergillus ibericus CBS 121593]
MSFLVYLVMALTFHDLLTETELHQRHHAGTSCLHALTLIDCLKLFAANKPVLVALLSLFALAGSAPIGLTRYCCVRCVDRKCPALPPLAPSLPKDKGKYDAFARRRGCRVGCSFGGAIKRLGACFARRSSSTFQRPKIGSFPVLGLLFWAFWAKVRPNWGQLLVQMWGRNAHPFRRTWYGTMPDDRPGVNFELHDLD